MFQSIHDNDPDPKLLAYQYLQTLPQLAQGPGNTMWMIPSELTSALKALSRAFGGRGARPMRPTSAPSAHGGGRLSGLWPVPCRGRSGRTAPPDAALG